MGGEAVFTIRWTDDGGTEMTRFENDRPDIELRKFDLQIFRIR